MLREISSKTGRRWRTGFSIAAVIGLTSAVGHGQTHRVIAVMDRDGTNAEVIVKEPDPEMTQNGSPSWSPDGTMIAFDSTHSSRNFSLSHVYVITVRGPDKGKMTDLGFGVMPTWSPDSKEIAFMLNPGNPLEVPSGIWITRADGTELRWVAEGGTAEWSPQGDLIATADYGRERHVYVVDVKSGERRRLFNDDRMKSKSQVAWAPDGRRLLFAPAHPLADELFWAVDVTQPQPTPVPLGTKPTGAGFPPNWGVPAWSPDGKEIAFNMFPGPQGRSELHVISTEKLGAPRRIHPALTLSSGEANWSPDSKQIAFAGRLADD